MSPSRAAGTLDSAVMATGGLACLCVPQVCPLHLVELDCWAEAGHCILPLSQLIMRSRYAWQPCADLADSWVQNVLDASTNSIFPSAGQKDFLRTQ